MATLVSPAHPPLGGSCACTGPQAQTGAGSAPTLVCQQVVGVLRLSKGKRRIALELLGPADFNRFGRTLSSKHARSLAERILCVEGCATHRYVFGVCHKPPENDLLLMVRHVARMRELDQELPRYEHKPHVWRATQ